jgi:hypothetical protein
VVKGSKWIGVKKRETEREAERQEYIQRETVSIAWCAGVAGVAGVHVLLTQEISRGFRCWN